MIKITIDENEWTEFFPEYADNLECPKKERVSCQIKLITQSEQDKLTDTMIGETRKGYRKQKSTKWSKAQTDMINRHVKDIKNVTIVKSGKEDKITTMESMYKIPHLKGLYSEIGEALDASSRLEDFETKN